MASRLMTPRHRYDLEWGRMQPGPTRDWRTWTSWAAQELYERRAAREGETKEGGKG